MREALAVRDPRLLSRPCVEVEAVSGLSLSLSPYFEVGRPMHGEKPAARIMVSEKQNEEWSYADGTFLVADHLASRDALNVETKLVRGLMKAFAASEGYRNLHAGCMDFSGESALIVAERNGGKTTFMTIALREGRARLVANDQVMVNEAGVCLGYPALVGVRPTPDGRMPGWAIAHAAVYADDPYLTESKPLIWSVDFAGALGSELCPCSKIRLVVRYCKAGRPDELQVTDDGIGSPLEYELPPRQAYGDPMWDACEDVASRWVWAAGPDGGPLARSSWESSLPVVTIKCGEGRLGDAAYALSELFGQV